MHVTTGNMPATGLLSVTLMLFTCAAAGSAEVTLSLNDPPRSGPLVAKLFDSPNAFNDLRDPFVRKTFMIDEENLYRIAPVKPGEYALLVYLDENDNGILDRNFIGIPTEPLGFAHTYRPAGPPSFNRAAFSLEPEQTRHFDISLFQPLGDRGRIGLGVGVLARSSPYRDYRGGVFQAIPAATYMSERFRIYGPAGEVGLLGSGDLRLAAAAAYRMGVYREKDSDFLQGMGNRRATLMSGPALRALLPGGLSVSVNYQHDVLDRIGGGEARLGLGKTFRSGILAVTPTAGVNWLSPRIAGHDYGVNPDHAVPGRPAYEPGDVFTMEAGLGLFFDIAHRWLLLINAGVERLDSSARNSPLVSQHHLLKGFAALNYAF